jgi:hypothetical protein
LVTDISSSPSTGNGPAHVEFFDHAKPVIDIGSGPHAGSPVQHLALVDQIVNRAERFVQRRVGIEAVAEENIDVLHVEPLERLINRLDDMLARQPAIIDIVAHGPVRFGADD